MNRVLVTVVAVLGLSAGAEVGLPSVDDVRVDALVSSHWGQKTDTGYSNSGNPCFNLLTPNGYPCGCNATPLAQLCRYWRYPLSTPSGTARCMVDGVEVTLSYGGRSYDYDGMPFVAAGADESSRLAIGGLTFDCAAALHSMFAAGDTFAFGMFSFVQLREVFGYTSAVGYVPRDSVGMSDAMRGAIIANLDAKCPVLITIRSSVNGRVHQALIDGYGYHGGKLYFHYNMGWCNVRSDDAWYEPGTAVGHLTADETYSFDLVDGLVYNVFPDVAGDVLSGRVVDDTSAAVAGAVVTATRDGKVVGSVETDSRGIYAFVLPGGATYKVTCKGRTISVALPASVSAKRMLTTRVEGNIWEDPFMPAFSHEGVLGGSCGNDLTVSSGVDPDPIIEPEGAFGPFNPKQPGKGRYPFCGVLYDDDGDPRGTITVSFTKATAKGVSKVSAKIKTLDGKSYSLSATSVPVSEVASATISGKTIKKFGVLDSLVIGESGFSAEFTLADGSKLTVVPTDLSVGLAEGVHTFSVVGLPDVINGFPVLPDLLPDGMKFEVNSKGKVVLSKATTVKYAKVKGSKPAVYELVRDTSKNKTNGSGLKLTYTASTGLIKGSFYVYTDNVIKHKVNKVTFTVSAFVIDGMAVGVATCKKPAMSFPVVIK